MPDQQTQERDQAWQGVAHKLEADVAKLTAKLRIVEAERDAYLWKLNTGTPDSTAFEALRESLAEAHAALGVADERIRWLEAEQRKARQDPLEAFGAEVRKGPG